MYVSISQSVFDYKGEAMKLRSKLDEAKKKDLRQSHFEVGGESYKPVSQHTLAYRPLTAA